MLDKIKQEIKISEHNGDEKMRLLAYAKLLNRKINLVNEKAQNPFLDWNNSLNPFNKPIYNTLVWVEPDDKPPKKFDEY